MAQTGRRPTIYSAAPDAPTLAVAPYKHDRAERAKQEWQACHEHKARLAIRGNIGKDWDGKAANDNIAWPLAKALLAEGNKELLKYAIAYRRIYTLAKSEAVLGGGSVPLEKLTVESLAIAVESVARDDGTVSFGKVRKSRGINAADVAPTRKLATNDESTGSSSSVPKPWNGDKAVNDMIDAKRQLAILQAAVGSILDPFEMMVVDGATLKEAGHAAFVENKTMTGRLSPEQHERHAILSGLGFAVQVVRANSCDDAVAQILAFVNERLGYARSVGFGGVGIPEAA